MTGHGNRAGDGAGESEIETAFGAVAIHRRQKNFAGAERHHFLRIGKGIEAGRLASAMGEDFPFAGGRLFGVDRHDNTLAAEFSRRLADDLAVGHGGGHDRHLVGAGKQQRPYVVERAHAAADGERHEAGFRRALDNIEDDRAVLMAGGDVEKTKLVGARRVVGDRALDRIAGVAQSRRNSRP